MALGGSQTRIDIAGGRFAGLGLKTGGASGRWWLWRARGVEAKQSREGGVSIRGSNKKLDSFTPRGYLGCVLHVRVFWSFGQRLYMCVKCF